MKWRECEQQIRELISDYINEDHTHEPELLISIIADLVAGWVHERFGLEKDTD